MSKSPDVLFVCVHNAGRSQMAKALFNAAARETGSELIADSAGTIPSEHVHAEALIVMQELDIDLSAERGKLLTDDMLVHEPRVITMGCNVDAEACPSLVIDDVVDWGLPDPKGRPLDEVREIRDEVKRRVDALLQELMATTAPADPN